MLSRSRLRRTARLGLVIGMLAVLAATGSSPASAQVSPVSGSGSTYAYIAIRQWIAQASSPINYTPTGSPSGLSSYAQGTVDFAGTEAEYGSLQQAPNVSRGYQYVPDVAGAVAIMYNLHEQSGQKVDYLHLDPKTVARIYIGKITRWSDAAISATNKGLKFPDDPINVVQRSGDSGTTALFYDFVAKTLGGEYDDWVRTKCTGLVPNIRPVNVVNPCPGGFAKSTALNDSEQIASFVGNDVNGRGTIGFDEFGYARKFAVPTAWIQNSRGAYVLPYAQNISAALEGARLRADLSQDLSGVYASANPTAYPISAYSYLVTQCKKGGASPACGDAYQDAGKNNAMAQWMRYIACDGQVSMSALGYSPLPPNLSQEMSNAISRLTGNPAEQLTRANCGNPRFAGNLGAGASSPCDPFQCGAAAGKSSGAAGSAAGAGGAGAAGAAAASGRTGAGTGAGAAGTAGAAGSGAAGASLGAAPGGVGPDGAPLAGVDGAAAAANGGSDPASWRKVSPQGYAGPVPSTPLGSWPALLVILALAGPVVGVAAWRANRAR